MAHTELGHKIINRVVEDLSDIATVGQAPKMEGRHLSMILVPDMKVMKENKKRSEDAEDKDKSVSREAVQENGER